MQNLINTLSLYCLISALLLGSSLVQAGADDSPYPEAKPIFNDIITVEVFNDELANTEYYPDTVLLLEALYREDTDVLRRLMIERFEYIITQNLNFSPDDEIHTYANWPVSEDGIPNLRPDATTYARASWKWDLAFAALIADNVEKHTVEPLKAGSLESLVKGCVIAAFQNQIGPGLDILDTPYNYGMVPHMNFNPGDTIEDYELWLDNVELWKLLRHSSMTQPPVLGTAVLTFEDQQDLLAFYPAIKAELAWWLDQRMKDNLPFVIHPWETGRDAARDMDSQILPYIADGTSIIGYDEVTYELLDDARLELLSVMQEISIMPPSDEASVLFELRSPDMAAYLVIYFSQAASLAELAGEQDNANLYRAWADAISTAVNDLMWDEASGFYYSLGRMPDEADIIRTNLNPDLFQLADDGKILTRVISGFIPLYAGIPSNDQALRLLACLEDEFNTLWPIPTVSPLDPGYQPRQYWRGSTWINMNYFVILGLIQYGDRFFADREYVDAFRFYQMAEEIAWKTLDMTAYGYYEFYPSNRVGISGEDAATFFTWSGLSINVIDQLESIDAVYLVDTDDDGLTNYQEAYVYHTDADNADSNGDKVDDGKAVELGLLTETTNLDIGTLVSYVQENPDDFGLYTEGSIMDLNIGNPMLRVENNTAEVEFIIEMSNDLSDWESSEIIERIIETDDGTYFLRIKAGSP